MPTVSVSAAEPPFVLVVDAGTSWVRAAVHDSLARPVEAWQARREHPTVFTPDGGVEKDAENTLGLVSEVIDEVLALSGAVTAEFAAVAMATLASSLVGVDAAGRPVTPIYLYADTRPSAEVEVLRQRLDEEQLRRRTGCLLHTSYLLARFLWLAVNEPSRYSAADSWLALPDFIQRRLLGRAVTSVSIASWSGLLNHGALNWDYELLQLLQVDPGKLPEIGGQPLQGLLEPYAGRWPALSNVPWFPAWADGAASNIGSGCVDPGTVALSLSTTGALRAVTSEAPEDVPRALWRYRVDAERALVGGAINEGGGLLRWAGSALQSGPEIDEAVARVEPDSHGLTILPFLTGERSPGWQSQLRGVIAGIRTSTRSEHIVRALMESSAYRFSLVARAMDEIGLGGTRLRANGGAADEYPTWLQIIADVLGSPVEVSAEREATSRGAAVLALERLGRREFAPAAVSEEVFLPDPERASVYRRAMERHESLYAELADWFERR